MIFGRHGDGVSPRCVFWSQMTRREGTSRVILYAPWAILHQRRVGHRYNIGTIKSIITLDFTGRITFRHFSPVDMCMADPLVTARSGVASK